MKCFDMDSESTTDRFLSRCWPNLFIKNEMSTMLSITIQCSSCSLWSSYYTIRRTWQSWTQSICWVSWTLASISIMITQQYILVNDLFPQKTIFNAYTVTWSVNPEEPNQQQITMLCNKYFPVSYMTMPTFMKTKFIYCFFIESNDTKYVSNSL